MVALKDLTGQRFGRLIAISRSDKGRDRRHTYWNCVCDCGQTTTVRSSHILTGATQSCGCYHKQRCQEEFGTLACVYRNEHNIWMTMIARCESESSTSFERYGKRGIVV